MDIYAWGISVIKAIQTIANPFLTKIIKTITFTGEPYFYLFILSLIFWCIDEKKGIKLAILQIFGGAINTTIKYALAVPRPFLRDPSVGIGYYSGYSTPSGHAQGTASFWSYFAYLFNNMKRWQRFLLAFGIPFFVGFSRVYLGVHYPTDVMLGWVIGYLLSIGFILFLNTVLELVKPLRWSLKLLLITIICVIFNQLCPQDTSMPSLLFGSITGWLFLKDSTAPGNKIYFSAKSGSQTKKFLRWLLGFTTLILLYVGLKYLFPGTQSKWYTLFRSIRYMTVGFTTTFLCPLLFAKLKLV